MKILTKHGLRAAAIMLTVGLLSACNQEKTDVIAFVNVDKVLTDSGLLAQEQTHLEQVRSALEKGAELAESHYDALDKEKADAARLSDAQALNVQWQSEQLSARNAVLNTLKEQATALQQEKKFAAIMPVQSALVVDEKADVSGELTTRLMESKVSFGELPQVTLKQGDAEAPTTH